MIGSQDPPVGEFIKSKMATKKRKPPTRGTSKRVAPHDELTTQEAADYLGVNRSYVLQRIRAQILPAFVKGKVWAIRFRDLQELAQHRRRRGAPTRAEKEQEQKRRETARTRHEAEGLARAQAAEAGDDELSVSEAAEFLGLARMTLILHIQAGLIPARRFGKFWFLRRRDVEEYQRVRAHRAGAGIPATPKELKRLIPPDRAARRRGTTRQQIVSLVERGMLQSRIVNGRPMVFQDEVEKLVPRPAPAAPPLTASQVRRLNRAAGTHPSTLQELADKFGISVAHVCQILAGKS